MAAPKGLRIGSVQFAPGLIPSVATLLMAILLFNLGLWQLGRAHYKEAVLERMESRSHERPMDLEKLLRLGDDINDYPVRLQGRYLNEYSFLLDNRPYKQAPGFELLTAFLSDGQIVLVNRGWIPQGERRDRFPDIAPVTENLTLEGTAHVPNPAIFVLKEDDYSKVSWPFLIQKIDLEKSAGLLDHPVAPFVLRLDPSAESGFVREWHGQFMGPEKHYGYAVQWFGLFSALLVSYLVVNTQRIRN